MKIRALTFRQQLINDVLESRKLKALQGDSRIKNVVNDSFEKFVKKGKKKVVEMSPDGEYIVNGKVMCDVGYKGGPRELPNSVTGPHDVGGETWSETQFFPEDIEKMKHMNTKRCLRYMSKLIEQNRFVGGEKYIK